MKNEQTHEAYNTRIARTLKDQDNIEYAEMFIIGFMIREYNRNWKPNGKQQLYIQTSFVDLAKESKMARRKIKDALDKLSNNRGMFNYSTTRKKGLTIWTTII